MTKASQRGVMRLLPIQAQGAAAFVLALVSPLAAQEWDFDSVAPKVPQFFHDGLRLRSPSNITGFVRPAPELQQQAAPSSSQANTEAQLAQALKGVILVDAPDKVATAGRQGVTGLHFEGPPTTAFDKEFHSVIRGMLGRPLDLPTLQQICTEIVASYGRHDMPVVDALVPEQDITSGVVQVLVVTGRLGQVKVEGNKHFEANQLAKQIRAKPGDIINSSILKEDIAHLNSNPFRSVDVVYAPGANAGETDIILKTKDRLPGRVYAGYENSGTDVTSEHRLVGGINWGNALGQDHQLNLQYMTEPEFEAVNSISGSYVINTPWRHTATVYGGWAETKADIGSDFDIAGDSTQVGLRYQVPIKPWGTYTHSASAGYDFKTYNNNLELGGTQVFDTTVDVSQFNLGYTGSLPDKFGSTAMSGTVYLSPGGMTSNNETENFDASRTYADASYAYFVFNLQRVTKLPKDFSWLMSLTGQYAGENLVSSEQFGLGGYASVRGYSERIANGDGGFLIKNELRSPPVSLLRQFGSSISHDQLQLLVFHDFGFTDKVDLLPDETETQELHSVGAGVRYSIAPYFSLRFDYGWQLTSVDGDVEDGRAHVGCTVSY